MPFFAAFVAGMNLVALADDAFTFLVSWEFMSLTSWALVMAHHHVPDNVRAGYVYLIMAAFGTLTLLLAFGLLAGPGGLYTFAQMRTAHPSATIGALALILALFGAGSKAGIVPFHAWLPLAHPAAPRSTTIRKNVDSGSSRKCAPSHGRPTGSVRLSGSATPRKCASAKVELNSKASISKFQSEHRTC